ncbi:MAG: CoA transferase [Bryobacteraceae bacterium]|nr:CoA transferase [Bryobacteraceae bacterium]
MPGPLAPLVVLDFTHALAGPYCTMLLANYGADVYKIEGPEAYDMGRTWGPPFIGDVASYFLSLNSGKRGLAIDLKDPRGIELCRQMIAKADVLIENFRPGTMERLGLGYAAAQAINPRLIYCSISGHGQTGPSRDEPAMDLIMQADSGLISFTGTADGQTARSGHSVADITAGMFALTGILMALHARQTTGTGQYVDVSMFDGMISAMASNFAYFLGSGQVPVPLGTAFATIVPYAGFPAADGEIVIAVASDKLWLTFCEALAQPGWAADPRFATNALRVEHRQVLEPQIVALFRQQPTAYWQALFRRHGIPCAPVRNLREVVNDPQSAHRDMFPTLQHPTAGPVRVTGLPIKLSATPGAIGAAAPLLGQHTRQALRELLGLEDFSQLEGVIHDDPR